MTRLTSATVAPIPFDPEIAREIREMFPEPVAALVGGAAGCSPYLAGLLRKERAWFADICTHDIESSISAELSEVRQTAHEALPARMRQAKRRIALLTGLADLGRLWSTLEVTRALTDLADTCLDAALSACLDRAIARGKLPPSCADKRPACGMVILAMGKMGAQELNYSSDIDLIVLFDETAHDPGDYATVRQAFIRVTREVMKMISDVTGDGYVFRTDLRLRPDPSSTPVCIAMDVAERYYESLGRTWERAAFIKARPCAGDIAAGEAFLKRIRPFVYRRHLDFPALEDVHSLMQKIRDHKGLAGPIQLEGHNVKLGRGGIREIEFFVQMKQLICAGRDPYLQHRQTLVALDRLVERKWVEAGVAMELRAAYLAHRDLEHRIQMVNDAQTHDLPQKPEGFYRIAAMYGEKDIATFRKGLEARFERVHQLTETDAPDLEVPSRTSAAKDAELLERWKNLPALRSERSRMIFARLEADLSARLSRAADPDKAVLRFETFLAALPAGVQVFSLFQANPALMDLIVDLCTSAPRLGRYMGRNAGVLDAVISPGFWSDLPDAEAMARDLDTWLSQARDYEDALDLVRKWDKEMHFRIGLHVLRGLSPYDVLARAYSDLAEVSLRGVYPFVIGEMTRRYGPPPGRGAAVIAMGKLGSREMTAASDLDLILIYDAPKDAESDGPKSLPVGMYYARFVKTLLAAMTAPTAEGALYEVDMRLRPSGRQGPVATSLSGYRAYQEDKAWTWEHLALARARVVAGAPDLVADVSVAISEVLQAPRDKAKLLGDTNDMRARLAAEKSKQAADVWNFKSGAGYLLDIDLCLQAGVLLTGGQFAPAGQATIGALCTAGFLSEAQAETLTQTRALLSRIQQIVRVALEDDQPPTEAGEAFEAMLCKLLDVNSISALSSKVQAMSEDAARVVDDVLTV